jgi:tRNA pseudouridine38-40 synthase
MQIIIRITILIQIINCMTSYSMLRKLPRFVALSRASLSQFVQPSIDNSSWKKRVVAMVVGYVGSSYHGLQMTDPILSTVEKELEMALYSVGSIIPSNHGDLSKIGWSRSSRTDRGVHAARLVISAKLELDPLWEYNMSDFVRKVNEVLPEDIRLYSCLRVNKGFRARESCHWRYNKHIT